MQIIVSKKLNIIGNIKKNKNILWIWQYKSGKSDPDNFFILKTIPEKRDKRDQIIQDLKSKLTQIT